MTSRLITAFVASFTLRLSVRLSVLLSVFGVSNIVSAQDTAAFASFVELPWRYVIGGYANGQWFDSEDTGKLLTTTTAYRVFTLDAEVEQISGAPAAPDADVCPDVMMQTLTPTPDPEQLAIGVHATWNPLPRKAQLVNAEEAAYQHAITELLASNGINKATPGSTQVLSIDLDDDGNAEELITATHYVHQDELLTVEPGDYSVVFLQRVVNGQRQMQVLSGEFYPEKLEDAAPSIHKITGVLDLNGDGELEVLVNSSYYEGGSLKVWQLQQDKLVGVLAIECGV